MTLIGMIVSISGAATATIALYLLRSERCPCCTSIGTLTTSHEEIVEDVPGSVRSLRRSRTCRECGAVVQDTRSLDPDSSIALPDPHLAKP